MATLETPAKHRLDMAHGFMKSVIRNQIDRDNYDKEVKAQQKQDRRSNRPQSSKHKKPELQTYVPPQRSKKEKNYLLYNLEYKHENGETYSVNVSKNDEPKTVASEIGERFRLPKDFIDVLTQRIEEEIDRRVV
ncbi:upf0561 protein c2orf68-like protein [Plakobranchus ocellatus]|uniref:Upf0561 protein c2orf68-like protein n=1 Tax=Plakobranchus ocellatus TaxID=259542 RepID=A0AAV3Y8C0_9GAST|nr:upf0561 protein c2orf68-like protein [Plakobranchus ocellatus]